MTIVLNRLIAAQREDHHVDGRITPEFSRLATDVNPGLAQAQAIQTSFDPGAPGMGG